MKSFSNFLISEELPVDDIAGRKTTGRIIKKREKKGKPISVADRERLDSARLSEIERDARGKKGQEIKKNVIKTKGQEDLLNRIQPQRPVKKGEKFYGKPSSVDVSTGKAKYVPPKEIQGRSDYIDPKTNKASEKGIKKYISKARQMRTGSNIPVDSKTTDSIAKIAKSEYTDKINQKYGGRRARRAYSNAPSLADVQKQVNLKDRLKQKFGKGEYRKGFKKTQGVNQADVSKKIASDTKAYNQKRTSNFNKFSTDAKEINRRLSASLTKGDQARSQYQSSGGFGDSNTGAGANTQNKPVTPKKTLTPSKNIKIDSKYTPPKTSTPSIKVDTPKPPKPIKSKVTSSLTNYVEPPKSKPLDKVTPPPKVTPKASSKITGNKAWQHLAKQGKLDTYKKPATVISKGMKTYKQFLTKTPKPLRSIVKGGGKVVGKALGPAFAAVDAIGNYKGYKKQGYGTTGSIVRSGAKTGAYWGGYAAGAAKGAALGTAIAPGVGTVIGGIAGGILGGGLAGKVADWGIGAYDKVFGGKKLKALKQSNIDKDLKANPWKAYGGKTPQISKKKTKFDQGSFRTVNLKKAKDGSYIMPKGWKMNTGKDSTLSRTTRLTS